MKKIFLIDDDKQLAPLYNQALELSAYEVDYFDNVNSVLKTISSENPKIDLFIIDIMLPKGNYDSAKTENGLLTGLYVALDIRKKYPDVPIILFSASPLPRIPEKARSVARKLERCAYISKAEYLPDKLVDYVDYLFEKGQFREGWISKVFESIILEPNYNGLGVDLRKLFAVIKTWWKSNKR
jgi:DNA-binding NtrC family response regulator